MVDRFDPYRNFRFRVEIDDLQHGGFQTVSGLERQSQLETFHEGGVNYFEHQFIVKTSYPALVLKRGLYDEDLWHWHQRVIDGDVSRRTVAIVLLDDSGEQAWRWVCAEAFPVKWTGAELDALGNTVSSESVELAHRGIRKE